MLHLASKSSEQWLQAAQADLETLLIDHAHCEKKAASTAINLIFRYPDNHELARALSPLAREELEHFELVMDLLRRRGIEFGALAPSAYAGRLTKHIRRGEPHRFIDTMLCCSLIEARSCERMKLLSEHLEDQELAAFYKDLLASEARHHGLYVNLATQAAPRATVEARLCELAKAEVEALEGQAGPLRMHRA